MLEQIMDVVRRAGEMVLSAHDIAAGTHEKTSAADLVTEYDLAVEAFLKERLGALLPEALFFGEEEEPEKQYVEIKTEQGRIPVYIGMPKDSVLSFMGKPDRASMSTVGSTVMEDWKYDGDLSTDMPGTHFHFVDGEMSSVTQIHY